MPRKSKKTTPEADVSAAVKGMEKWKAEENERKLKEKLIGETYKYLGQIAAADMFGKFANVSKLVWLNQVKETGAYEGVVGGGSWESFCNLLGFSRQHIDRQLLNLRVLGEEFLNTVSKFKVGYRELQKLRWAADEGEIIIEDGLVKVGDREIPIDDSHKEDLKAAIELLIEDRNKKDAEAKALKKKVDNVENEEIKGLRTERTALIKENQRLQAFFPEDKEPREHTIQQVEKVKEAVLQLSTMCRYLILDESITDHNPTLGQILAAINTMELTISDLKEQFYEMRYSEE